MGSHKSLEDKSARELQEARADAQVIEKRAFAAEVNATALREQVAEKDKQIAALELQLHEHPLQVQLRGASNPSSQSQSNYVAARNELAALLDSGSQIKQSCIADTTKPPPMTAINKWADSVIAVFAKYKLDDSFKVRLLNPSYPYNFSHGAPQAHEQCWNAMNKVTMELTSLIGELKR